MTAINPESLKWTQEKGVALDGLHRIQRDTGGLRVGGMGVQSGDRVSFHRLTQSCTHRSLERERVNTVG